MNSKEQFIALLQQKYNYFCVFNFICDCGCDATITCISSIHSHPRREYCKKFDPKYKSSFEDSTGIYCCYETRGGLRHPMYISPIKNTDATLLICVNCAKKHNLQFLKELLKLNILIKREQKLLNQQNNKENLLKKHNEQLKLKYYIYTCKNNRFSILDVE